MGAALGVGAAVGIAWGLFLPGGFGFFAIFLGMGIGYVIGESVSMATNRKAGPVLQSVAVIGALVAYVVHNLAAGDALIETNDLSGFLVLIAAVVVAAGRVRF